MFSGVSPLAIGREVFVAGFPAVLDEEMPERPVSEPSYCRGKIAAINLSGTLATADYSGGNNASDGSPSAFAFGLCCLSCTKQIC